MYQPQIGDRVKYHGYTPEAYRNGSVPTFMIGEGIVIELDGKLYLKLDTEYIIPVYYLDNLECIKENCDVCFWMRDQDIIHPKCPFKECIGKTEIKEKRVVEQDLTPEEEYYYSMNGSSVPAKCNGCDAWIDYTGTPAHCAVEKCIKEYKCLKCETLLNTANSLCESCFQKYKKTQKEESFFGHSQFQEDTRMETCKYYSDYNQCAMGHYDEDHYVFCAVCLICDDYTKFTKEDEQYLQLAGKAPVQSSLDEYKKRPIRRT